MYSTDNILWPVPGQCCSETIQVDTTVNHYLPSVPFTVYGAVRSLLLPCPPLQQAQHSQSGIEHIVMFKDHLIEGVQRQSTSRICVLQCSHGHVQPVGLVTQGRLLGCDHFHSLLHHKNKKHISTLKRAKASIFRDPLNPNRNIIVITCLSHFLWCLA